VALSEQLTAGAKRGVKHEGAETVTRAKPS